MITRTTPVVLLLALLVASSLLRAASSADAAPPSALQLQRADKIAAALALADAAQTARVRDLVARQYRDLGIIHAARNAALTAAKDQSAADRTGTGDAIARARTTAETAQDQLHAAFLAALAAELTPAQIDQVKDGMTYGVLPLTFRVYQQMLPTLTADQKAQILAWLTEAREHAMDASTSEEKHAWFGKYKGRINNFLSKAGYDMKAAEKNLNLHR